MASIRIGLRVITLIAGLAGGLGMSGGVGAGVDLPKLERGKGDRCVEDLATIRRDHPNLLKHHRDDALRRGIRTPRHSLKGCVECHAGEKTGSVASTREDFCMACHTYAAVKLDCWDCHATKPGKNPVTQSSGMPSAMRVPADHGQGH